MVRGPWRGAVCIALGLTREGEREGLGLWIADTEGARFWLSVMNELRNRGVQDILIAVVDGLKGFPEAITAAFPETTVQTCIVHLIRHSMTFCSWKDRKAVAADLRPICEAPTGEAATKLIFPAIRTFEKGGRAVREWVAARNQLAMISTGRFDA